MTYAEFKAGCMIPFLIRLPSSVDCTLVLLVWVPLDKISVLIKIRVPRQCHEGTSSDD